MSLSSRSLLNSKLDLYMVTTELPDRSHIDIAEAAIQGGAPVIQYRDKNASTKILYSRASKLRELTKKAGALLIINDRLDIAQAVGADGVHLGQDDLPLLAAREILGDTMIIGISATCLEEALVAADSGADYIGLGPIFPTPSKDDAAPPIGIEGLMSVRSRIDVPIVAIGGITVDTIKDVIQAGADSIAVISAVTSAENMVEAASTIRGKIKSAKR